MWRCVVQNVRPRGCATRSCSQLTSSTSETLTELIQMRDSHRASSDSADRRRHETRAREVLQAIPNDDALRLSLEQAIRLISVWRYFASYWDGDESGKSHFGAPVSVQRPPRFQASSRRRDGNEVRGASGDPSSRVDRPRRNPLDEVLEI